MPHIDLPEGVPGIIGPMMVYPHTAEPLNALADQLLTVETSTFTKGERELVAAYVSYLNGCVFCSESHGAVANHHFSPTGVNGKIFDVADGVLTIRGNALAPEGSALYERLNAFLRIAKTIQGSATKAHAIDVATARFHGATDRDIHDCVLIAAAFCMFNRYVEGLATLCPPRGHESYAGIGKLLAETGYATAIDKQTR